MPKDEYAKNQTHGSQGEVGAMSPVYTFRCFLQFSAFLLVLAPTILKMYETSHWFRSKGDPSRYDIAKDWLAEANIPYNKAFHHDEKILMRVYFFIVPYVLSAICVAATHFLQDIASPKNSPVRSTTSGTKIPPRSYLVLRSILEQTWRIPHFAQQYFWPPSQVSTAEMLGIATYLTLNIATFAVRVKRSYPRGTRKLTFLVDLDEERSKEQIPHVSWEGCEIWAKTLGILAIMNIGWYLILPVGRKSVMLEALCLSWERAVKYHRWIGYYTFLLALGHGIMYIGVWVHGNGQERFDPEGNMVRRNLVPWGCSKEDFCDEDQKSNLRVNFYGFMAMLFMIIMTVFTIPWIRRNRFEWFYYSHHLFILVVFFLFLHYDDAVIYLIPGIAMYMVDKVYPLFAYRNAGTVKTRLASADVLEISVPTSSQDYYGGAYIFLNVPSVSWLQWHPFSLTSAPGNGNDALIFHVKDAGSWTKAVLEAAADAKAKNSDLTVRIDGFYGHNVTEDLSCKNAVVLVGGGIGVTPMLSIARDLLTRSPKLPVYIFWVVRSVSDYGVLSDELVEASQGSNMLKVRVWITMSQPEPTSLVSDKGAKALSKEEIQDMPVDKKSEEVVSLLKSIRATTRGAYHSKLTPDYCFDNPGVTGTTNALIMMMSVVIALSVFALIWHLGEVHEIEPRDKVRLLFFIVIVVALLVFIFLVKLLRRDISTNVEVSSTKASSHGIVDEESEISDTSSADIMHISFLKGRIGCRPDFESEFRKIKSNVDAGNSGNDVGVLACGPMAMVKNITQICNTPKSGYTWGVKQEDGNSDAYFSFTEEDWEW